MTAVHTITFDNLGEVTALQRGELPAGEPLGRHFSVTRALPRILDLLDEAGLRATFFVEGLNTELYPETLSAIAAAGHEIAYHGWCHEEWAGLEPGEEAELLARGVRALDELGLRPLGFRPPGGELNAGSLRLLRELGFTHCSPAGDAVALRDGVAILPFAWPLVDAYHYLPRFAGMRGSDAPRSPEELARILGGALEHAVAGKRHSSVVFHPFLAEPEDRFAVMRRHLQAVRELVDGGELWCAPNREVAVAVNEEIRDLFAAGADVVQIDEPWLQAHPDEAREYAVAAIDRAVEGIEGTTALHTCFGYAHVVTDKPPGYSFFTELNDCAVDQIAIESAQPRLDLAILREIHDKTVILGVLDLSDDAPPETADEVAARIEAALEFIEPGRLQVAPDCGMKYLPRDVALAKLRALVEGAAMVRARLC